MASKKRVKEACSTDCKCGCGHKVCGTLVSAAIIALLWIWPAEMWSKIVITVLAAVGILAHLKKCNC